MAIQTRTILPTQRYTNLVRTSPDVDVPARLQAFTIRMVSTEFTNPALTCSVIVRESYDSGQTWRDLAGFDAVGGTDRFGQPMQPSVRVDLSQEQRDAALMRAEIATAGSWRYGFVVDLET